MDKSQFSTQAEYEAALAHELYQGKEPVDPKLATQCNQDRVNMLGLGYSETEGRCDVSEECTFIADKISGVSGYCLKQALGVSAE